MAIERIQSPVGASPSWQPDEHKPVENKEVARTGAASPSAGSGGSTRQEPAVSSAARSDETAAAKSVPKNLTKAPEANPIQVMSEKLKALQVQSQTDKRIFSLNQEMFVTRQELAKITHEKMLAEAEGSPDGVEYSYWAKLDVVDKARTINQLKDRLEKLELERSALVKQAAEQISHGSYRVTGAEILAGMLEEYA